MKQLLREFWPDGVRITEVPPPLCAPGGVLVGNVASLISSGTERAFVTMGSNGLLQKARERGYSMQQLFRRLRATGIAEFAAQIRKELPDLMPLGYSAAGRVLEVGAGAEEFAVGNRVASAGAGYANHAEMNWIPKNLCVKIPAGVDDEEAAAVAVGAVALQAVRAATVQVGEKVAVVGLGLVGLLVAQILKAAGCVVWGLDPDPDRVHLARQLGVDLACENHQGSHTLAELLPRTRDGGADAVIIAAATKSAEPFHLAGQLARERGAVVIVGEIRGEIPRWLYYKKELRVLYSRSYGPGRYDPLYEEKGVDYPYGFVRWTEKRNMEAFLDLVAAQKVLVRPLITHRFSLEEASEAYQILSGKKQQRYVGMLITYPPQTVPVRKEVTLSRPPARARLVPTTPPLTAGWIGAGKFSQAVLIPALKKIGQVKLRGLANASGLSARRVGKRFGFQYCTTDCNEILSDPDINMVFVATRHNLHGPLVISALEHGKHVFVEKPLCVSEHELRKIAEKYYRSNRVLTVGFNRRFSPFARECQKVFQDRREPLSIVYRVNAAGFPPTHWVYDPEEGHGPIIGEVCHFVDLIQYLSGSLPVEVQAWSVGGSKNAEDNLHIRILLADGSRGEIFYLSSGDASLPKERIEVFGQGRTVVCDDFRKTCLYAGSRRHSSGFFRQHKGHREELKAFVETVAHGGELPIPFESLLATTVATLRIRESLHRGKPIPVALPTSTNLAPSVARDCSPPQASSVLTLDRQDLAIHSGGKQCLSSG